MHVLGFHPGAAFCEFKRLIMQDGSSFAVHDAWCQAFPGRFRTVKPAAVALHRTLDGLRDAPITIVLSPDTDAEHAYRPAPASLTGALVLADRGSLDLTSLRDVDRHGGSCIVRGKAGLHPRVIDAYREDGRHIKSCQERDCQAIIAKLPTKQRSEVEVEWLIEQQPSLKRFFAHAAEQLVAVVLSTRKAAMMPADVLPELFRALRGGDGPWFRHAFAARICYLGSNAKRAHPKRDARTGRSQLGLKPLFELTDQKACMDNGTERVAA